MARPDVFARLTPAMRKEFDALHASLKAEIPSAWQEPTQGDLVGALIVLVREAAIRAKLRQALGIYYDEKG